MTFTVAAAAMQQRRRPFLAAVLAFLVLDLPGGGRVAEGQSAQAQAQDAMAQSGIAMTQGFDFGNSALDASKGRNMATTSRVNQNFLRRGTRADLERIAIERLMGRRGPDDWLLAGSDAWLARRAKLDREAAELRERIAIAEACTKDFNIEECESLPSHTARRASAEPARHAPVRIPPAHAHPCASSAVGTEDYGCVIYCGTRYPCAGCNDGLYNGDETGVDCGGSCVPCPTCDDMIMNGMETGIDCGGEVCDECEVFVPEPEPGDVCNSLDDEGCEEADLSQFDEFSMFRPPGCTAPDARDCIIKNKWTAQSGAHLENQPWYVEGAEFYPWQPGSRIYNSSHWRECAYRYHNPPPTAHARLAPSLPALRCCLLLCAARHPAIHSHCPAPHCTQMTRVSTRSPLRGKLSLSSRRTMGLLWALIRCMDDERALHCRAEWLAMRYGCLYDIT